ncbi:prephenate dehydrogenase [Paraferrimonas sp. SM1919]|uniref:prephenate dehydrogenase n=1 Tax=Paraferrimonas sp. SM1919 TaxID=2662263 RepID=UPI0013D3EE22|nr:prephenate dehydrogenase [Paraferrimonas sp. SM1919]
MSFASIFSHIKTNLQTAYRQALDADQALEQLSQSGKAKFNNIFDKNVGFTTQSNRFKPYVEELSADYEKLSKGVPSPDQLQHLVTKLGLLLQTLQQFKESLKG